MMTSRIRPPFVRSAAFALTALLCGLAGAGEVRAFQDAPAAGGAGTLAKDEGRPVATFSGFKVNEDGSSSIRVDMTKSAQVTKAQKGTTVRYVLAGAKIRWSNNKNPLRTEHFSSNVLAAKLDSEKEGVALTITLRTPTETQHRVVTHAAGVSLYIDVPAPSSEKAKPTPKG